MYLRKSWDDAFEKIEQTKSVTGTVEQFKDKMARYIYVIKQ